MGPALGPDTHCADHQQRGGAAPGDRQGRGAPEGGARGRLRLGTGSRTSWRPRGWRCAWRIRWESGHLPTAGSRTTRRTPGTWPICCGWAWLAEAWIAPLEVRELRELTRYRILCRRRDYLTRTQGDGRTRLDRLLGGELDRIAAQICDETAGPYDMSWDGNWPSSRPRLRAGSRHLPEREMYTSSPEPQPRSRSLSACGEPARLSSIRQTSASSAGSGSGRCGTSDGALPGGEQELRRRCRQEQRREPGSLR